MARALAADGATVAINYVSHPEAADAVIQEIEEAGGKAIKVYADVSKEADVQNMFREVVQQLGTVHILINNAGIQQDAAFVDMTLDQWNLVIGVNLTGQFFVRPRGRARVFCAAAPSRSCPRRRVKSSA